MVDNLAADDLDLPVEELPVENLPIEDLPAQELPEPQFRQENLGQWVMPEGVVMEQYLEDDEPFNVAMPHDDLVPQRGGDEEMF